MNKSNENIKLGMFVIIITLIFVFVVYKLSDGRGFMNSSITICAEFDDVEGLLLGNKVRYSGVSVGIVSEIEVVSDRVLKVTMSLDSEVEKYMKSDAEANISTDGLVGNMLVNITPGKSEAPNIKDGDFIKSKEKVELNDMLESLATTNDRIAQISEVLLQITEKINNGDGSISQLLNDSSLADNLKIATRNLSISSQSIMTSTDSVNSMITNVAKGYGNLGYLFKDNSIKHQISLTYSNIDSLINDRTQPILNNLEASSLAISNTSADLDSIINNIENNEGLLGTVLHDEAIATDLKTTFHNIRDGTQKFDESMEALQHNWLLRKFFKKKEKAAKKAENKKK